MQTSKTQARRTPSQPRKAAAPVASDSRPPLRPPIKPPGDAPVKKPHRATGNPRGRPPGSGQPKKDGPAQMLHKVAYLPKPPAWGVKTGKVFVTYWRSLTPDQLTHAVIYVYRLWPVINRKAVNPDAKKSIDILTDCPFEIDTVDDDILHRYGVGDYQFLLNENPGGLTVCRYVHRSSRDFDHYPPRIDPREISINDPANNSYTEWLRISGKKLPGDPGYTDPEEAEMNIQANADAQRTMADTIRELAMNKRTEPDVTGKATLESMKMINEAAATSMRMVENTAERMREKGEKETSPFEMVNAVVTLAKEMRGDGNGKQDTSIFEMMLKQSMDREARMSDRVMKMEERLFENQLKPTTPPKTVLEQLREMREMRRILKDDDEDGDEDSGKSRRNDKSKMDTLLQLAPIAMRAFDSLMRNGSTALYNYAIIKTGQGTPIAPGAPQPGQVSEAPPATAPTDAGTGEQPDETMQAYHQFLAQISPSLLHHIGSEELTGVDFANWLITSSPAGRLQYDALKESGADNLTRIMMTYAPLWNTLKTIPDRLHTFLSEFMEYDTATTEDDEDEETGEVEPPIPATAAAQP